MITKNKTVKIKKQVYIKIFNLARQDIFLVVFARFAHWNNLFHLFRQIYLDDKKIDTHIKLIEQNKKQNNVMQGCTY
jgi:hypothetical protein